ncbi:MAG: hypothetical protein SH856_13920, partial [Flavobacteriales bacterium]|nr:hypothetical protein [Flavobacteriales bacterium]
RFFCDDVFGCPSFLTITIEKPFRFKKGLSSCFGLIQLKTCNVLCAVSCGEDFLNLNNHEKHRSRLNAFLLGLTAAKTICVNSTSPLNKG